MFLKSSRYFNLKKVAIFVKNGREVKAITLRRLPHRTGKPTVINGKDRLDILAQDNYNDATRFWHIADANSEMHANNLLEVGREIKVPEK